MSEAECEKFVSVCEEGILCDARYCPYVAGETSRLGVCEGDFCEKAWNNYIEKEGRSIDAL